MAFGEAVARGILPGPLTNLLYLVVALSMALTPYLAALGAKMGQMSEKGDVKALQPAEEETRVGDWAGPGFRGSGLYRGMALI